MYSPPKFHVREADNAAGDGEFIIAAFDSALPYLASIGSHEQWGLTPFSDREGWVAETLQQVQSADTYRLTGKGNALRILVIEAEFPAQVEDKNTDTNSPGIGVVKSADGRHELHSRIIPGRGKYALPVGFAFLREDNIPEYILTQDHLKIEDSERDSCVYIEVMVADHRVASVMRKGSGSALIEAITNFAREARKKCLFIDGWAGNCKKLIGYYEQQGFQVIDDFSLPRKDKSPWVGTFMRMDIPRQ